MRTVTVTRDAPVRPGTVATLGRGDVVTVSHSAVMRADWAAMGAALMVAYARGATLRMYGWTDTEGKAGEHPV